MMLMPINEANYVERSTISVLIGSLRQIPDEKLASRLKLLGEKILQGMIQYLEFVITAAFGNPVVPLV